MEFKDRLVLLINRKDMMQKEVAEELDLTAPCLNRYVKGNREPDIETLKIFAKYFNTTIDYLIGYSNFDQNTELFNAIAEVLMSKGLVKDRDNASKVEIDKIKRFLDTAIDLYLLK